MGNPIYTDTIAKVDTPYGARGAIIPREVMEEAIRQFNDLPEAMENENVGYVVKYITIYRAHDEVEGSISLNDNDEGRFLENCIDQGIPLNMSIGGLTEFDDDLIHVNKLRIHTLCVTPQVETFDVVDVYDTEGELSLDSQEVLDYNECNINIEWKRLIYALSMCSAILLAVATYVR